MAEVTIAESGKIDDEIDLSNIRFEIRTCNNISSYQQKLCIILELTNSGKEDFYFTTYSMLLEGFSNDRFSFQVSENMDKFTANYFGPLAKIRPKNALLKAGQKVLSELFLEKAYDFVNLPDQGVMTIFYHSHITFCKSDDNKHCADSHLDGQLELILGANTHEQQFTDPDYH